MSTSVWLILSCVSLNFFIISATLHTPVIQLDSGPIRGFIETIENNESKSVRKYLGIPFARAERFENPVPPHPWTDVKDATSFGRVCHQYEYPAPFGATFGDMSEDCLNLNVYVPNIQTSNRYPVMVWIHGGSFAANSNRISDGSILSYRGKVIVVVINYRLGWLGFLSSEEFDLPGNYGLYDQLEALKWVQKNIDRFGGDPQKVTIFGNSAGGMSVSLLALSPLANDLFNYTIMQSGVAINPLASFPYDNSDKLKNYTIENFDCTETNIKACLKAASARDLTYAWADKRFSSPVIDGTFLTDDPQALIESSSHPVNSQSVLIGVADDDGSCLTDAIPELSGGFQIFGDPGVNDIDSLRFELGQALNYIFEPDRTFSASNVQAVIDYYANSTTDFTNKDHNIRIALDVFKDVMFFAPAVVHANYYVARGVNTFFYQVEYGLPMPGYFTVPPLVNAYHETEKFMAFGFALKNQINRSPKSRKLSKRVMRQWSNFAKTGNPNTPKPPRGQVQWPQYDEAQQRYLAIKPTMAVNNRLRSHYLPRWETSFLATAPNQGANSGPNNDLKRRPKTKPRKKTHKPKKPRFSLW